MQHAVTEIIITIIAERERERERERDPSVLIAAISRAYLVRRRRKTDATRTYNAQE